MNLPSLPNAATLYAVLAALTAGMVIGWFVRGTIADATIADLERSWETERRTASESALVREKAIREKEGELDKMRGEYAKLADARRADRVGFDQRLRDERAAYLKRIAEAVASSPSAGDGVAGGASCMAELAFVSGRLNSCASIAKDANERGLTCQQFYEEMRRTIRQ